jgi:heat shock protein HtpX
MNTFKTVLLMTLITLLLVAVGLLIGGRTGGTFALGFAFVLNFFSYWFSDKIVLKMYGAKEVSSREAPELHSIVDELTRKAGLPMPRVYIIPSDSPNAFATGRSPSHAAVAVTKGILDILSAEEVRAVLSHELAHVRHRDILTGTIVATMAGAIMLLSRIGLFFGGYGRDRDRGNAALALIVALVAPIAAMLIQLAISRSREYAADAGGAKISGDPIALANALRKLHGYSRVKPMNASPATAHMFIVNPLSAKGMFALFSTHPAVENRIERLQRMAR